MAEMENPNVAAVPPPSGGLSFTGLYEVLVSPVSFFEKLKDSPRLLVPWILLGIASLVGMYLMADYIVPLIMQGLREQAAERGGETPPFLTPEFFKYMMLVTSVLGTVVGPLIIAATALFFGNVVMAGKAKYKNLLSAVLYSEMVTIIALIVTVPLIIAKGSPLVSISLGALVTPDFQDFTWRALSQLSVWFVWQIAVLGIGFSAIYGFSRNKGLALSVISIGIFVVLRLVTNLG